MTAAAAPPGDAPACYTTAFVSNGCARFEARHARRLARDAHAMGLGDLDTDRVTQVLRELAVAAFGAEPGVIRVQASRGDNGEVLLLGNPRPLGNDPSEWRAIRASEIHDGGHPGGPKRSGRKALERAAQAAREAGADEALLFDAEGILVEGARTNIVVVTEAGALLTPPLSRGAVAGIAREIALERVAELREDEVDAGALLRAREIIALNAVRGARPVAWLDGEPVGDGTRLALAKLVQALRDA